MITFAQSYVPSPFNPLLFHLGFGFETGPCYAAQAAWNPGHSSCFNLPCAGITGMHHSSQRFYFCFEIITITCWIAQVWLVWGFSYLRVLELQVCSVRAFWSNREVKWEKRKEWVYWGLLRKEHTTPEAGLSPSTRYGWEDIWPSAGCGAWGGHLWLPGSWLGFSLQTGKGRRKWPSG